MIILLRRIRRPQLRIWRLCSRRFWHPGELMRLIHNMMIMILTPRWATSRSRSTPWWPLTRRWLTRCTSPGTPPTLGATQTILSPRHDRTGPWLPWLDYQELGFHYQGQKTEDPRKLRMLTENSDKIGMKKYLTETHWLDNKYIIITRRKPNKERRK